MEGSFKYYIESTVDCVDVELFKENFSNQLDLFPDKICSYKIIYDICVSNNADNDSNMAYKQRILNKVWIDYFKKKINGRFGVYKGKNKKNELENDFPLR